jgi:hypothetical protein
MKVMAHLMFGIVALTVDEILRLCTWNCGRAKKNCEKMF